jgi:hypothetical protein
MSDIINLFNDKPDIFEINKKYLSNDGLVHSLKEDKKFLDHNE